MTLAGCAIAYAPSLGVLGCRDSRPTPQGKQHFHHCKKRLKISCEQGPFQSARSMAPAILSRGRVLLPATTVALLLPVEVWENQQATSAEIGGAGRLANLRAPYRKHSMAPDATVAQGATLAGDAIVAPQSTLATDASSLRTDKQANTFIHLVSAIAGSLPVRIAHSAERSNCKSFPPRLSGRSARA